jgi:hypothetical protein
LHLAYSSFCSNEALQQWDCIWCADAGTPNMKLLQYISNEKAGTQGYVGLDVDSNNIVVAFRGSYNTPNAIEDAEFWLSDCDFAPEGVGGVKVEHGFQVAYNTVREEMLAAVATGLQECPSCTITFTGHSLGAAMATLSAAEVASTSNGTAATTLFTFGCPRVGNTKFVEWSHSLIKSTTRVARERDIVPHIPPQLPSIGLDYVHPPQEIWNRHVNYGKPNAKEWLVECDGVNGEDPECSNSEINYSGAQHTEYLGFHGGYC